MKRIIDFFQGVNPVVLIGAVMTPIVAVLLAVVTTTLNFHYTASGQWDFVINTMLAAFTSYFVAFLYIKWRTSLIETGRI